MLNLKIICQTSFSVFLLALISCSSKPLQQRNDLKFYNAFEKKGWFDSTDTKLYVVKNDGQIVYGQNVHFTRGQMINDKVRVDKELYKEDGLKAYKIKDGYFARFDGKNFAWRFVHGKLNVYAFRTPLDPSSYSKFYYYRYFLQKGDNDKLREVYNLNDIKTFVSDCSKAVDKLSITSEQLNTALKTNPQYLNEIVSDYNAGCMN